MIKKLFLISIAALLMVLMSGFNVAANAAVLSLKTPVLLQSDTTISETTNKTGDIVKFHVAKPVESESGQVIIPEGTPVKGTITRLEQKKRIGRPTEVIVSGFTTTLANGKQITFNGQVSKISESRMTRSIVLSVVVFPLFLLMKGAAVELPAGSQVTVYPSIDFSI